MSFTQTMAVEADDADSIADLIREWHREQAGVAPGYRGGRVLADLDQPGRYVIEIDFTSEAEARENSDRPETQRWADSLRALAKTAPTYHNYAVSYTTD